MIDELDLRTADAPRLHPASTPRPVPRIGLIARVRAWAWLHRRSFVVVGLLLALAAVVHASGMSRWPGFADDEGTYVAQAWAVQHRGALTHYTYWYDHPPLGWIQIAAWTLLTAAFRRAPSAVAAGREAMLAAHLASCGLVYVLTRRLRMQRVFASAAVVLFALSPLAVEQHRMVYLDNVAVPWLLGAFVLALSPARNLWAAAGSGVAFAVAVLTKETTLLLLPALAWQLWSHAHRKTRQFCLTAFASSLLLVVLLYPLFAVLKGELVPGPEHVSLIDAIRFQLLGRHSSGSVFDPASVAHRVVMAWWRSDPWLLGTAVVMIPLGFVVAALRPVTLALAIQVVTLLRHGYLPAPFVIAMLPFAALLLAGLADFMWGTIRARRASEGGRRRWLALLGPVTVTTAGLVALTAIGPVWLTKLRAHMTTDAVAPLTAAREWIVHHVPKDSRILVDDTLWVDLVERGFDPDLGVVWFYKLDFTNNLDPSVARRLPGGWREFDYLVSTPIIRTALSDQPDGLTEVRTMHERSAVLATFGEGGAEVEVRRVEASPETPRLAADAPPPGRRSG